MQFKAEVGKLLDIVANSLYSEKEIFLRELVSNASDAIDKLKYMALLDPKMAAAAKDFRIELEVDDKAGTLTVSDNGIGMSREDLEEHLGTIAKSGTADFVRNTADNGAAAELIGQFGVGFYSAFMVAEKVEVVTKRAGDGAQAWKWVSDGRSGFEIAEASRESAGTTVTLFLKKDERQYLDTIRLRHIVRTYSDHIDYPIVLKLGAAGDETINSSSAIWARPKAEVSKEQYIEFYRHISRNFDEPWLKMHFKAEGSLEWTALLFIPSVQPADLFQPDKKQGLKLYSNKVFISEKVEELLPNYLRFIKGVVDSSDLPLNISREMLQHSALVGKIRNGIVSRVLKELGKKASDKAGYAEFWNNFGAAFKEGIYEDFENREKVAKLSRFYSSASDSLVGLDDYIERAGEGKPIYYITGDDPKVLANNPQLEAFKAAGIEVLLLVDPIDEFWVQVLTHYKGHAIKPISQAEGDFAPKHAGKKADEGSLAKLISVMSEVLKDEVGKVEAVSSLVSSPAALTVEAGQMSLHLERLMKSHNQQMAFASTRVLQLNAYHPLIAKMADLVADGARVAEMAKMLLDMAKVAEGLPVGDPGKFSAQIAELMMK